MSAETINHTNLTIWLPVQIYGFLVERKRHFPESGAYRCVRFSRQQLQFLRTGHRRNLWRPGWLPSVSRFRTILGAHSWRVSCGNVSQSWPGIRRTFFCRLLHTNIWFTFVRWYSLQRRVNLQNLQYRHIRTTSSSRS